MDKMPTRAELITQTKDDLDQRVIKIAGYMDEIERIIYSQPAPNLMLIKRQSFTFEATPESERLEQLNMLLKEERRLARFLLAELMCDIGLNEDAAVIAHYWRKKREARP